VRPKVKQYGSTSQSLFLSPLRNAALGANIFRATQTDTKLRRENIQGKDQANQTHLEIGKIVRKAIAEAGGTMPENLPTPEKSIQELQRDEQKRIEAERQPHRFSIDSMSEQSMWRTGRSPARYCVREKNLAHTCHFLQPFCVFYANGRCARFWTPCVLLQ
jgi:hypothetical protein